MESGAGAGEDTLASQPVIPVNSLAIAAVDAPIENVGATTRKQFEEGEILTMASQETTEPLSRFGAQTPPVTEFGDVDARLGAPTLPVVEAQDMDVDISCDGARVGRGDFNISKDGARVAKSHKGTFTATLDFDESEDDVFEEETRGSKAAHLT